MIEIFSGARDGGCASHAAEPTVHCTHRSTLHAITAHGQLQVAAHLCYIQRSIAVTLLSNGAATYAITTRLVRHSPFVLQRTRLPTQLDISFKLHCYFVIDSINTFTLHVSHPCFFFYVYCPLMPESIRATSVFPFPLSLTVVVKENWISPQR